MTSSTFVSHSDETDLTLLRLPAVLKRTGFSRSCLYKLVKQGCFPRPVKIGRMSGWIAGEINNWIHQKVQNCRLGAC
ncbi:MAG: AlpA family transcriptional regulator [Burkholderiaceae bacterium]|nr:AlpA family transcriptional regulator [Sulfuritalea sp.]MCF8175219.1 AlpA family transcriptional regulator [Burkholderiaceae bacterium]MCF8183363.1 AlpA family transcriptional regulator [Polynucleobacter sp.]